MSAEAIFGVAGAEKRRRAWPALQAGGTERDRSEALRLRPLRRTTLGIVTRMGGDAREDHGRSLSEVMARLRAPRA
jgi:hypothetical protein